jgi:hypothetical protein
LWLCSGIYSASNSLEHGTGGSLDSLEAHRGKIADILPSRHECVGAFAENAIATAAKAIRSCDRDHNRLTLARAAPSLVEEDDMTAISLGFGGSLLPGCAAVLRSLEAFDR